LMRFWIWRSEENKYFELVFFRVVHKNLRNYFFSMVKLKQTGSIFKIINIISGKVVISS